MQLLIRLCLVSKGSEKRAIREMYFSLMACFLFKLRGPVCSRKTNIYRYRSKEYDG